MHVVLFFGLTILSGICDAYGFSEASKIWREKTVSYTALIRSAAGYAVGIGFYWFALRFITQVGVTSATVQTLTWFAVTIVGVTLLSGDIRTWDLLNWSFAVLAVLAVGGLLYRS